MKALSIRQPWAWMIVAGGKNVENRRWNTHFRGEFYIHAAKGVSLDEYNEAVEFARDVNPFVNPPPFKSLERGGIVGRARLIDVISPCSSYPCAHPWHVPEQFGFVLSHVQRCDFIPLSGALGFFNVDGRI